MLGFIFGIIVTIAAYTIGLEPIITTLADMQRTVQAEARHAFAAADRAAERARARREAEDQ